MNRIFLLLVVSIMVFPLFSQKKVNDVFSSEIMGKGNLQQEIYYNSGKLITGSEFKITNLYLRYGLNSFVELQLSTSIENFRSEGFDTGNGMGPFIIGGKFLLNDFNQGNAGLAFSAGVSIPGLGDDQFVKQDYGIFLDLAYENRISDIYKLGINLGLEAESFDLLEYPYLLINNEIAITEYLDVYVEYNHSILQQNDNSHYMNLGTWLWISEDIKLLVEYGKDLRDKNSNDTFSIGAMIRWLD